MEARYVVLYQRRTNWRCGGAKCAGRVVGPESLTALKDAVTSLSQLRVIVLDLSSVEIIDARGLGMLVFLHNWACATGIQVKLVNPSKLASWCERYSK